MNAIRPLFDQFAPRWVVANIIGWSVGLYIGSQMMRLIGDVPGLLLGAAGAGCIAGAAQLFAINAIMPNKRLWVITSTIGGFVAALPVFAASSFMIFGQWLGFLAMGAVFGACFGLLQSLALADQSRRAWVLANIGAGSLCAAFTLTGTPFGMPVFCTFGPVTFGVITAWVWGRYLDGL